MHKLIRNYILILLITANFQCSAPANKLDSWLGDYGYGEPSIKALAGYNMVMVWDLSVHKVDDSYKAILNVQGQQTGFSDICSLSGNDSTLFVIYDDQLSGPTEGLQKGDTLFSLSKKKSAIITSWAKLAPRLADNPPKDCPCFGFEGRNKNNNTIRVQ